MVPAAVVNVMVEPAPEVTDAGENDTTAPVGAPEAVSATGWALPLVTAVETDVVAVEPETTEVDDGVAEIEKSLGGAVTVTVTTVVSAADGPVPSTVIG